MAKPRVLYLAPVEPWCRENGSSLITADLLVGLAQTEEIEVLPLFLRNPPDGYTPNKPAGLRSITLGVPGLPRWLSVARSLMSGSSPLRMRFDNRKVEQLLIETMNKEGFTPDVIHVEHLPLIDMGHTLAQLFRCPLVYRAHNIESQLWARRLRSDSHIARRITHRLAREEAKAIALCDLTLCISDVDLEWVYRRAPEARVDLLPCSLLVDRYPMISRDSSTDRQMCFIGGLEWTPNEIGLRWFVDGVLPLVLARVPEATLAVLARGAQSREWLTTNPAVKIVAANAAAADLFAASTVSIAPLLEGGGVRIKIPESLALGCPVVATPIGAEGHDLDGVTSIAEPAVFASACVQHLTNPLSADARLELRANVDAEYGAKSIARRLSGFWLEVIGLSNRRPITAVG